MKFEKVLHGGDYNPEQFITKNNYAEEIEADIIKLKDSGINFVTVGIFSWKIVNPSEGVYDFEYMDYVMKRYTEEGFDIVMSTQSAAFPNWLKYKYPSINRVTSDGVRNTIQDRHNHCYSSLDTRRELSKIIVKFAERYKEYPIVLWHISNEMQGECFCESCIKRYRKWLQMEFETIENLNDELNTRFWSHEFNSFDEINPPMDNADKTNPALRLCWSRFNTYNAMDIYEFEAKLINSIIPDAKHTTNLCYGLVHNFNYHEFAKNLDIVSWDSYPRWHNKEDYDISQFASLNFDMIRGLKQQNFFLMESTCNSSNWRLASKSKRPKFNELTAMHALACGSQSIGYFQMRRSKNHAEVYHSAIIDDFIKGDRVTKELKLLGDRLESLGEILETEVKNDVAIVYDWDVRDISTYIAGPRRGFGGMNYMEYVEEIHKEFNISGINTDLINLYSDLSRYKMVIVPMHYLMSKEQIRNVLTAAQKGVKFFITGYTGLANKYATLQVGGRDEELEQFIGCDLLEFEGIYDWESATVKFDDTNYKTRVFHEYIRPHENTEVLAMYNYDFYDATPAIVKNGNCIYSAPILDPDGIVNIVAKELNLNRTKSKIVKKTRMNDEFVYDFYFNFTTEPLKLEKKGYDIINQKNINGIELEKYEYVILKSKNKGEL